MFHAVTQKFASGCMMLARRRGDAVDFLGSSFVVAKQGYLLTAAHLVADESSLVVVPNEYAGAFSPMTSPTVAAMPVRVTARDTEHDVALLKIDQPIEIGVPDDFLGLAAGVQPGASVMALGYAFGHHQVHSVMSFGASVVAKMRSRNDTALILYDSTFHEGDRGGPLVHLRDGHIVGIVSGRFEPGRLAPNTAEHDGLPAAETNVSYAVAIEYGLALLATMPELDGSAASPEVPLP